MWSYECSLYIYSGAPTRAKRAGQSPILIEYGQPLFVWLSRDWPSVRALKLPECGPTISDHTKQHCRNKRSMIPPEAWTPVIIDTYVHTYSSTDCTGRVGETIERKGGCLRRILVNPHLLHWTFTIWLIDSCQKRIATDQYHMNISRAHVSNHRGDVILKCKTLVLKTATWWMRASHFFDGWHLLCLVPVLRFPSPSRSICFGDVSEANGRETSSHFRMDHVARNALAARKNED